MTIPVFGRTEEVLIDLPGWFDPYIDALKQTSRYPGIIEKLGKAKEEVIKTLNADYQPPQERGLDSAQKEFLEARVKEKLIEADRFGAKAEIEINLTDKNHAWYALCHVRGAITDPAWQAGGWVNEEIVSKFRAICETDTGGTFEQHTECETDLDNANRLVNHYTKKKGGG